MKATLLTAMILVATSVLSPNFVQAQKFNQEINVSKQKDGVYLEIKQTPVANLRRPKSQIDAPVPEASIERHYWIASNTVVALQAALRNVLSLADLNQFQKKDTEKEAARIWVMDKDDYMKFGYLSKMSKEAIITYYGQSNGSFDCVLNFRSDAFEARFRSKQELFNFISLLGGKSVK